jgi:hypothetical protein
MLIVFKFVEEVETVIGIRNCVQNESQSTLERRRQWIDSIYLVVNSAVINYTTELFASGLK